MQDKIVYVPVSSIKERLKGLNAAIKNAPDTSEWQKGRRDMLKDILTDYLQENLSELLKESFDAGYDYRSSLLPEVIAEFGEGSMPGFKQWLTTHKQP